MDPKELKENRDLKAFQGQKAQWALVSQARRESMENRATWEGKVTKGRWESPDLQEGRGYKDPKETWD